MWFENDEDDYLYFKETGNKTWVYYHCRNQYSIAVESFLQQKVQRLGRNVEYRTLYQLLYIINLNATGYLSGRRVVDSLFEYKAFMSWRLNYICGPRGESFH